MQQAPELALLDTWMLYRNMDSLFAARPDSLLFGAGSPLARRTASRLHRKARHLASDLLTPERYELMRQFVAAQPLPAPGDEVQPDRTMLPWVDFLRAHGIEALYPVGTIAEVMADMGDRIGGVTQQTTNAIDWTGDLLSLRIRQDSLRDRLAMQLDSLERDFNRLTAVAEDLPGVSREVPPNSTQRSPKPWRLSTPASTTPSPTSTASAWRCNTTFRPNAKRSSRRRSRPPTTRSPKR